MSSINTPGERLRGERRFDVLGLTGSRDVLDHYRLIKHVKNGRRLEEQLQVASSSGRSCRPSATESLGRCWDSSSILFVQITNIVTPIVHRDCHYTAIPLLYYSAQGIPWEPFRSRYNTTCEFIKYTTQPKPKMCFRHDAVHLRWRE